MWYTERGGHDDDPVPVFMFMTQWIPYDVETR